MQRLRDLLPCMLIVCALFCPRTSGANDIDGPDDCTRHILDMGDAPEGILAYPGVTGHFPTCLAPGVPGTYNFNCAPLGTPPGPTGYVLHETIATGTHYWLGCSPNAAAPMGIDSDADGKVNLIGGGSPSACSAATLTDCAETAFGMTFGQDEAYGDDDAGLAVAPNLKTCTTTSIPFHAYSCGAAVVQVYLNILVDMNHDGDWNDNIYCNLQGACGNEWAVKNAVIALQPGCNALVSPVFRVGPNVGGGWLRITLSDQPVNDDFPWAGSATIAGGRLQGGETEDHPVVTRLGAAQPCDASYNDFGDAPENIAAYPGVIGHFPTCTTPSAPGTVEQACPSGDPPPGLTGYVEHVTLATDASKVGLGCGTDPAASVLSVDDDVDGKVNLVGAGSPSDCQPAAVTDAAEIAFGGVMTFGQDEAFGDDDAGVSPPTFKICTPATVSFRTFNCGQPAEGYLNVLVDMNEDGDWNDSFLCGAQCAREWAVRNQLVPLPVGCFAQTSPVFLIGPRAGHSWMRVSVSLEPVPPDFAWNGSAGLPGGTLHGGETEDYPVEIGGDCNISYRDFGDAPEGFAATSTFPGHYPTCLAGAATAGNQEIVCGTAQSIAPPVGALAGYVEHISTPTAPWHFWFGCGPDPAFGVDDESDGKSSPGTPLSACGQIPVDCTQGAFGLSFGQDECLGDGDAGLAPVAFRTCSTAVVSYKAYACDHEAPAYLNILVDWSQDGDWNDNVSCGGTVGNPGTCVPEWAVKNAPVLLAAGCNNYTSPAFMVGPKGGNTWMRMTLSPEPAPEDFPWNGTAGTPNGSFTGGETEDYPISIVYNTLDVASSEPTHDLWFAAITPNPGTTGMKVRFGLPRAMNVKLTVFDLLGRRVNQLANGSLPPGEHTIEWNYRNASGEAVPVGFYLVKLEADGRVFTRRVIHAH